MPGLIARVARAIVGDYRLNWVLRSPAVPACSALPNGMVVRRITDADRAMIAHDPDPKFRASPGFARIGANGFVLLDAGKVCCITQFAGPEAYAYLLVWPLAGDQLALLDLVTRRASQGRGLATLLIGAATYLALYESGKQSAICFIWWNHHASLRAFRRAGWRRIGFSVELTSRRGRVIRWRLRLPGA